MPEPIIPQEGANGDEAAAKAAADKKVADDAAAAAAASNGGDGEETVTIKKSDLKKIEDDRDNYRTATLIKKTDERNLHPEKKVDDPAVINEQRFAEVATVATNKALRDASEKTAKRTFIKNHPEYVDDAQWVALMSNLTFKGDEVTVEDVADRMESALLEHKRSTGKLTEYLNSEHERGVREGRIQGELGSGHGTGGAGDRNDGKELGTLSPTGERMAQVMHVDPAKVKKVDISKDNMIDITKI